MEIGYTFNRYTISANIKKKKTWFGRTPESIKILYSHGLDMMLMQYANFYNSSDRDYFTWSDIIHQVPKKMNLKCSRYSPSINSIYFTHFLQFDDLPILSDRGLSQRSEWPTPATIVTTAIGKLVFPIHECLHYRTLPFVPLASLFHTIHIRSSS